MILNFKKTLIILICLFGLAQNMKAQGVDVIFWMDNSSSIDATEWTSMTASTKSLIDQILGCNPNNRISVVHYGATTIPQIYIESDFTNNATTAKNFVRRSGTIGGNDQASESLTQIGNALDGINNTGILSTQKNLSRAINNKLVIFLFTDASRSSTTSYLVSRSNVSNPYIIYNQFKIDRKATFVTLHAPTGFPPDDAAAHKAAAAIASLGGSYTGSIEANTNDPEGSGVLPRKTVITSTFTISPTDIDILTNDICRACAPIVKIDDSTPSNQTVCVGGTPTDIKLAATGSGVITYQWYSNTINDNTGGTLINGATSATYTPQSNFLGTTYYYAIIKDSKCDGIAYSSSVLVKIEDCCNAGTAQVPLNANNISN